MNSIFKYLRSKLHVLLFLVLELLCIIAIFRFNSYQASFFYSNTRRLSLKLNEMNSAIFDYFALYNKNQALFNENLELRRKMKTNYVVESKAVFTINDTVYKQRYRYYPAQVITNSTNKQNNYITINRGSSSGLQKGMGVFCPDGIVGTITEVSDNYAIASSVLNTSGFKLVPKIKELNYTKGTIVWDGKDPNYLDLREINKYEALKEGYHIVTSPYSKNYPEDIPIGTIEKLVKYPKETYYRVKVKSAVNFGKIQTVYVVIDMFKDEIEKLERQVEEKEKKTK